MNEMEITSERADRYLALQDSSLGKVAVCGEGKYEVREQRRDLFGKILTEINVIGPMDSIVVLLNTLSVSVSRRQADVNHWHGKDRFNHRSKVNRQIGHLAEEVYEMMKNIHVGLNPADVLATQLAQFSDAAFRELGSAVGEFKVASKKLTNYLVSDTSYFNNAYEEKEALEGDLRVVKRTLRQQYHQELLDERSSRAESALQNVNSPDTIVLPRASGVYRPNLQNGSIRLVNFGRSMNAVLDAAMNA